MKQSLSSFWKEILDLNLNNMLDAGEWTATTTGAGLGLAIALGVANPSVAVAAASLAFASPLKKVIEVAARKTDKKLTLEEVVAIAAPLAYVKSFNYWIEYNSILGARINQKQNYATSEVNTSITNFTLNRELAINALRNFHESELGDTFNQVLSSQLQKYQLSDREVKITVAWVAWKAGSYFKEVIEESKVCQNIEIDNASSIDIYIRSSEQDETSFNSIEKYLNEQIAKAPKTPIFEEKFSLENIYVPLKIKSVDLHGQIIDSSKIEEIEEWAKSLLCNSDKAKQVMFIQAGPGRGKSVFCQIFADWIRQYFYPLWIPILIRLRDVESFDNIFEETLQAAIKTKFVKEDTWLVNSKLRFLFILDGFDEIRLEGRARGALERFIKQVASFQESCNSSQNTDMGHRFILTGRQLALQGISYLPDNLERVELLAMDDKLQQQWLDKWQKIVDLNPTIAEEKTAAFKDFLRSPDLSNEVKEELAREPLLLYLLSAMHRDGKISVDKLIGTDRVENEIAIYEQAVDWVLTRQRERSIQSEIVTLDIEKLKQVLIEAGLVVIQSGGESAKIIAIENRLSKSRPPIAEIIKRIRETKGDEVLKNALAAFYIKPKSENYEDSTVKFFHTSFGEFLCAKRMQQSIQKWIQWDKDEEYYQIQDRQFFEEVYDIFGYGNLTPEIIKFLFGLLENMEKNSDSVKSVSIISKLFKRLEKFYQKWCDEEFTNASEITFAQKKMRQLNEELPDKKLYLGQNSVEIFTILNIAIILFKIHSHSQNSNTLKGKINFHPCGESKHNNQLNDNTRFLRIIGLSFCLGIDGFIKTIGSFLSGANLSGANLSGANLSGANLSGANLSGAILRQTNLTDSDLSGTDLSNCDMCRCDLTGANLQNALLKDTYLRGADCRNAMFNTANLEGADLCRAYLYNANFSNAIFLNASVRKANLDAASFENADFTGLYWDVDTNWFNSRGLHKIINPSDELSNNLDFQDGIELSKAYELLQEGHISEAISMCKSVTEIATDRIGDPTFKAHIYNRFAWLCSLLNKNNECREEIADLAEQAVKFNFKSGNYKDTLAIATILNPKIFDMPPVIGRADDDDSGDPKNPYEFAIKKLEEALECEDFKKLALPNMAKIRQRRQDWIKSLQLRINPLTSETISLLLKEEY